jgi:protein SCO1/2
VKILSKTTVFTAVAAVAAMSAGFWLSSTQLNKGSSDNETAIADARKNFSPIQGSILSPARKIAVPALVKDNGELFGLDDLTGGWHLLFFGYTHCPDICPMTLGVLAQAKKTALENNQVFPQVILVSVDPERDKVEMLADYVQYFDKDFIGVTGEPDLIKALTLQMSVVYMKMPLQPGDGDSGYLVDHSSALLLINPQGKLLAFLNPPHDAATIVKDIQTVIRQSL